MGPHKDPAQLPTDDQLKLLRHSVDKMQFDVAAMEIKLEVTRNEVKILRTELKDFGNEIKKEIKTKFDKIMDRIDEFIGRINTQDKEIAAIAFRKEEHETRIKKLETTVFATP